MIKEIIKDEAFLAQVAEPATAEDEQVAQDLLDTLEHLKDECVGLAANMIGVNKAIIAFDNNGTFEVMYNPKLKWISSPYKANESCLSLEGERVVQRFRRIKVAYQVLEDGALVDKVKSFRDWTAEIIQHEVDHCNGVVV